MNYFEKEYTDGFFKVSGEHGFLPVKEPLKTLPVTYEKLQKLIDDLHFFRGNDKTGVLGIPDEIVKRVSDVPNYKNEVEKETDVFILQALYRAYTFVTSGFTLELSYQEFKKSGNYGIARQFLPKNIAEPLVCVSQKLEAYPFLDYHYSYSIGNYVKKDPNGTLDWKNLDMACKFTGSPDEVGFIMVHVYINELSPNLVDSIMQFGSTKNHKYLKQCSEVITDMNKRRREMWVASKHENYNDFRIFIMGIKGNEKIYGEGLIYENCFDNKPQQFRGQTGAQDSIIPMLDIFTGIVDYYPQNKLTEYLLDLRSYRPVCIQNFFKDLREYYVKKSIFDILKESNDITGLIYLLKIVDEVYLFRNGHWQFVQKYIMSNTKYAFATGGTPITTWLINQIEGVLEFERVIIEYLKQNLIDTSLENYDMWIQLEEGYSRKRKLLLEQVQELQNNNYNIDLVYLKNSELKLEDSKL